MNSKDEQEEREEYFNKKNISQGVQDIQSAAFKITEKYERSNYVDYSSKKKMNKFKDNQFNGSEVYVNKYGQKLLKNTDDPRHKPETDHIVAANRTHTYAIDSDLKHITDDDIKKAINRESNFELISKSWNASKKHRSDKEFADNKNKKVEVTKEQEIQLKLTSLEGDIRVKTELHLKNAEKGMIDNASKCAASATASNLTALVTGNKSLPEAAVDTVIDTIKQDIKSTGIETATTVAKGGLKEIEKGLAKQIGKKGANKAISQSVSKGLEIVSNNLGNIVQVGTMMADSVVKFAKGEIDGKELMIDAGGVAAILSVDMAMKPVVDGVIMAVTKNVGAAAGTVLGGPVGTAIGAAVGLVVGELISLVVASTISKGVLAYKQLRQMDKLHNQKYDMIDKISRQALEDMGQRRNELEKTIKYEFSRWDRSFNDGFKLIFNSLMSDDAEGVAQGLSTILSVFNSKSKFATCEEFDAFWNNPNKVLTL